MNGMSAFLGELSVAVEYLYLFLSKIDRYFIFFRYRLISMPKKSHATDFRYRRIADALGEQIKAGHWQTGDRLPSVRALMQRVDASMSTIVNALLLLEASGMIRSMPRSGWFVAYSKMAADSWRTTSAEKPMPVSVNQMVLRLLSSVDDTAIMAMGSTTIDRTLLPVAELNQAMALVARRQPDRTVRSGQSVLGEEDLRRHIARLMAVRDPGGVPVMPDEIVITAGDGLSMEMILQLVAQNGVVAVESPTYFGNLQALENLGLKVIEIATDATHGIDLAALERALQQQPIRAVIVSPTCQNPFGFTMSPDAKCGLLELARRHDLTIIEDDIYGELFFGRSVPPTLHSLDRDGRVVFCSSFSKTLSPSWRVGWMIPGVWRDRFLAQKLVRGNGVSSLPQLVLAQYLSGRSYSRHLVALRALFQAQALMIRKCVLHHFPAGTKVAEPQGGYVFWIELPDRCDAVQLSVLALNHGISIAPGAIFSADNRFPHAIRLSVGAELTPFIRESIAQLGLLARDMDS